MRNLAAVFALAALPVLPACLIPPGATPRLDASLDALTQYNHRGMVQNEEGVLQGEVAVGLPGKHNDAFDLRVWGNMDLRSETGEAWFPDGHGGEITEWDAVGMYSRPFGAFDVSVGVFHYGIANGAEFASGPSFGDRGPTSEAFASVSREVAGFVPSFTVHYDFDEVEDVYLEAGVMKGFTLNEKFALDADARVAWSGEDSSLWTYGFQESGLADLRGRVMLSYFADAHTTVRAQVAASTILDSAIEEWFDLIGIESDNVWAGIGVTWSY